MRLDLEGIRALYAVGGKARYGGEAVTQLQHALQCAELARRAGASAPLIAAAFLHDLGHLVHGLGEDCADRGIDDRHESTGALLVTRWFGPAVSEPVRLHVAAKRWLCVAEPAYAAGLSPASQRSLALQGGAFSADEGRAWIALPHAREAVALRRWDDSAKDPAAVVPGLDRVWPMVAALAAAVRPAA